MERKLTLHLILGMSVIAAGLPGLAGPVKASHTRSHPPAAATDPVNGYQSARSIGEILKRASEGKIEHDANVYIAPDRVQKDDVLKAYAADTAPKAKMAGVAVPGLLGIAAQAYRAQEPVKGVNPAYSLADAMRDAIWRKETAARLKALFGDRAPSLRTE